MATNERLRVAKGCIFDVSPEEFDGAVAFFKWGFNPMCADFHRMKRLIEQSKVAYLIFSDIAARRKEEYIRPFICNFESWSSIEEAEQYVRDVVRTSLDEIVRFGNRIAFHGVKIHGMDVVLNEQITIEAIKDWLKHHPDTFVSMIDKYDSFSKYLNQ